MDEGHPPGTPSTDAGLRLALGTHPPPMLGPCLSCFAGVPCPRVRGRGVLCRAALGIVGAVAPGLDVHKRPGTSDDKCRSTSSAQTCAQNERGVCHVRTPVCAPVRYMDVLCTVLCACRVCVCAGVVCLCVCVSNGRGF